MGTLTRAVVDPTAPVDKPSSEQDAASEPTPLSADPVQYREFLDVAIDQDPYDKGWAHGSEEALRDNLTAIFGSGTAASAIVECRSSLCRVRLALRSEEYDENFVKLTRAISWKGPGFITSRQTEDQGTREMIMYLGKEGTTLPDK